MSYSLRKGAFMQQFKEEKSRLNGVRYLNETVCL